MTNGHTRARKVNVPCGQQSGWAEASNVLDSVTSLNLYRG